jgi:hypothetical protein
MIWPPIVGKFNNSRFSKKKIKDLPRNAGCGAFFSIVRSEAKSAPLVWNRADLGVFPIIEKEFEMNCWAR